MKPTVETDFYPTSLLCVKCGEEIVVVKLADRVQFVCANYDRFQAVKIIV